MDDVTVASAIDEPLFNELREILRKHGALRRFGITFLHPHFHMDDDELFLEETEWLTWIPTHSSHEGRHWQICGTSKQRPSNTARFASGPHRLTIFEETT
jgi:hypothetical protein